LTAFPILRPQTVAPARVNVQMAALDDLKTVAKEQVSSLSLSMSLSLRAPPRLAHACTLDGCHAHPASTRLPLPLFALGRIAAPSLSLHLRGLCLRRPRAA
jgi:hypothetical protein